MNLRKIKSLLLAIFLCGVLTVGLQIAEPVQAATYEVYDVGSFKVNNKKMEYITLKLSSKKVDLQIGNGKVTDPKTKLVSRHILEKNKNKIKIHKVDQYGSLKSTKIVKTKKTLKSYYKSFLKAELKKVKSKLKK